jgi:glycosyltransferase involved in cell wall biosynthesis
MILTVLVPAHNEGPWIRDCLAAILASHPLPADIGGEVLVLANGCTDDTAESARSMTQAAQSKGWQLRVVEIEQGGKLNALNEGDRHANGAIRVYVDADVIVDPALLPQIAKRLNTLQPRYASGRPRIAKASHWITRAYAGFWSRLPFMTRGVPGFGVFAVNAAGRARWTQWPDIISDDTFARLSFAPDERIGVEAGYVWPMVEGFSNLVRVRRRQDAGVAEIRKNFPKLLRNDEQVSLAKSDLLRLFLRDPLGFVVYAAITLAVRSPLHASTDRWARGR